ncbi:MAG: imidazoleglycerol-phosphate dehydratase HisB [Anaerolineae bacterium]
MNARRAEITRETRETHIEVDLNLDGSGQADMATGVGMLDHFLAALARHGRLDLRVRAAGDLAVDEHHTVEDVAIVLGLALKQALGDGQGITRMGHAVVPMDEALALVAVDLGGRGYCVFQGAFQTDRIGELGTDLVRHFLETLAHNASITLHAHVLYGQNDHHKAEALFKALGRALEGATRLDPRLGDAPPSTKGTVEVRDR